MTELPFELQEFIINYEKQAEQYQQLYNYIVGFKNLDGDKQGLIDRVASLEKRIKNPDDLEKYISKFIDKEIDKKLEIKRREIQKHIWSISSGIGGAVTFLITVIFPFLHEIMSKR